MKKVPLRLAEALKNVCKKSMLEDITVSEITAEAGLTRQAFYRYFDDKFELALWVHYTDLYQAMKRGIKKNGTYSWKTSTIEWLNLLKENAGFYRHAFQSAHRKEFQTIIKDFFYQCYVEILGLMRGKEVSEEEKFVIDCFCIGIMEKVVQWIVKGAQESVETMLFCMELALPKPMLLILEPSIDSHYAEMVKTMEEFLFKRGLLKKEEQL